MLAQKRPGAALKVARDLAASSKLPHIHWIFESGFVQSLRWDPREWHWQVAPHTRDAPFFGYTTRRGYNNARKPAHHTGLLAFVQGLNFQNSTPAQVIARIWHNARPRKVGTLIWLTLNKGLPVGTWL